MAPPPPPPPKKQPPPKPTGAVGRGVPAAGAAGTSGQPPARPPPPSGASGGRPPPPTRPPPSGPPPPASRPPPPAAAAAAPPGAGRGLARGSRTQPPSTAPPPPAVARPPPATASRTGRGIARGVGPRRSASPAPAAVGPVESTSSRGGTAGSTASSGAASTSAAMRGREAARGALRLLRTRPDGMESKTGVGGAALQVMANYFPIKEKGGRELYQYRVDFEPGIDHMNVRWRVLAACNIQPELGKYVFDRGTLLYSFIRHDQIIVRNTADPDTKQKYTVTIRYVRDVTPGDTDYTKVFNVILRRCLQHLRLKQIGTDHFDNNPAVRVMLGNHNLELWPGFKSTSIRRHENESLLNLETAWKVLRRDDAMKLMNTAAGPSKNRDAATRAVIGTIVITEYNNATYKIETVNWNLKPTDTFDYRGTPTTYVDYYRNKYNVQIRNLTQPLLHGIRREKQQRRQNVAAGGAAKTEQQQALLIPELCRMTGLTDQQRGDFRLMADVAEYTRTAPSARIETLMKFSRRLAESREVQQELADWNVTIGAELVKFKARTLAPETIIQGGGSKFQYKLDNADWGNTFRNASLYKSVMCQKWACVYPKGGEAIVDFVKMVTASAIKMGFQLNAPRYFVLPDNREASYSAQLRSLMKDNPGIIMTLVPGRKGETHYNTIKKICYLENPMPSQVITQKLISKQKQLNSVATKVALQMAAKLGGEPWAVAVPLKTLMVIGYDSFHDTVNKRKSVGAVVSTLNPELTRFTSSTAIHENNDELHQNMKIAITKAIKAYIKYNGGATPKRFIVYRDGVGEGDIARVKSMEISVIKEAISALGIELESFSFIIVSKRINTRFFRQVTREDRNVSGPYTNPHSGTVVDDVVTLPERYDFFLISQSVRQGTVNPTSYNVIQDEGRRLEPDRMQWLTYKLTHLYFNWPGTVKVPMVCQYAHKLCNLVGESLHTNAHAGLEDYLYYL